MQGSVRPGRPLLSWLGVGTGPYRFPLAAPCPKLQGECTSAEPSFPPAFAQTAPLLCPSTARHYLLPTPGLCPRSFLCRAYLPNVPPTCVPTLLITVVGLSLTSSAGWVGSVGEVTLGNSCPPYIPQGWLRTSEHEGANTHTATSSMDVSQDDLSTAMNRAPYMSVAILRLPCSLGGLTASPGCKSALSSSPPHK